MDIINITNKLSSYCELNEKMQTLKRKCDTLCCREADIITQLQHEESSCTKKRRKEVENWFQNVASTIIKVHNIEQEVRARSGALRVLLGGNRLVDRVEDLTKEVAEYMEQGLFPQGLTLDAHEDVALLTTELVGRAFQRNLETIWELLRKAEVLIIGVWGMGGVGKTTLIKHIHNRILEHPDTFDHVYWITVSQNTAIRKLQDDIAKAIRLDISSEDDESRRAAILSRELKRRNRSVIILDDVWNDICLESVGIATAVNGCKVLISARSLDVCRRLSCDETIKIEPLSEGEAWLLFEKTLRHSKMVLSVEVLEVAKCVAQECAGLPLGINTMASSMRRVEDIREWRSLLQALTESEDVVMGEKVFKVLELSYNRLNDPIVQQCFLYCALYPEDHDIAREELIQHLIDERLIGGQMKDRRAQFDRGHAILNKLVNSGLLEVVETYTFDDDDVDVDFDDDHRDILKYVKMHDLVRDMAIKMKSSEFMVKAGMQLEEIPEEQEWSEYVQRVSFMDNYIAEISSSTSPMCPKLLTLFLSNNRPLKKIEKSFFEHMPVLQVLNLSSCKKIEELPSSISNLKNLSALVVRRCRKLQNMPSLAEVTSLKRLDLSRSDIREVPQGLEMLVNLTYLDLRGTRKLEVFPSGMLPTLSRLEYLKFDVNNGVIIKGEELKGLERLGTFKGCLTFDDKVNGFKEYVVLKRNKFCSYELVLDDGNKYARKSSGSRQNLSEVILEKWSISKRIEDGNVETLEALLKDVQSLQMVMCEVPRSLSDVWWLDNATQDLKRCNIELCDEIECVGRFSNPSSSSPLFFQTLETLKLGELEKLRNLFEMEGGGAIVPPSLPVAVFSSLIRFTISNCDNMEKLFQPGFLPNLQNLEQIHVSSCDGLEEIITSPTTITTKEEEESMSSNNSTYEYDHSYSDVQYRLPKLKTLYLRDLPKLKSICKGTMACDALKGIYVYKCNLLQRIPLSKPPSSLKSIFVEGEAGEDWWESVKWDDPNTKNLFQPYLKFNPYLL